MHRSSIDVFDLDALDLLELFDTTLYLITLGGFVAEALDEALDLLDFLLLVLIGTTLLLESLLTKDEVVAVVRLVVVESTQLDL